MEANQTEIDTSVPPVQLAFADREAIKGVCRQAHSALLWLARLTNSFNEPAPGDEHLLLGWVEQQNAIVSPEIAPGTIVGLYPHDFYLQFCENGTPTQHPIVLDDISPSGVEAWCLIELLHRNLDRDRFSKYLPYDTAGLMKGDAEEFETFGREAVFERFGTLVADAIRLLKSVRPEGEVRIDPKDFAIFVRDDAKGEIGLCLGDTNAAQPYYYRSPPQAKPNGAARSEIPATEIITADAITSNNTTVDGIQAFLSGDK